MTEFLFRDDSYLRETPARVIAVNAGGRHRARPDGLLRRVGRTAGRHRRAAACGRHRGPDRHRGASGWRQDQRSSMCRRTVSRRCRAGDEVTAAIDWDRRYRLMRMHTALHLALGGLPLPGHRRLGRRGQGPARFRHAGSARRTSRRSKRELNAARRAAIRVTAEWITDAEMAANPGLIKTMKVKPPMGQGRVRLVRIGDVDLQPCGGTHVANTRRDRAAEARQDREEGRDQPAGDACSSPERRTRSAARRAARR